MGRTFLAGSAMVGCYDATRGSALSGVPKSAVYWWARHGVVTPSISPVQEKLWSYADLMALRIVSWLRHPKPGDGGMDLPPSPMPQVRRALALFGNLRVDIWDPEGSWPSPLLADRAGKIYLRTGDGVVDVHNQSVLLPEDVLGLTAPFDRAGLPGPDLVRPRPHLRIVPAKVAGDPHIQRSRLTTQTVAALARRGFSPARIAQMYDQPMVAIADALDLERELSAPQAA